MKVMKKKPLWLRLLRVFFYQSANRDNDLRKEDYALWSEIHKHE